MLLVLTPQLAGAANKHPPLPPPFTARCPQGFTALITTTHFNQTMRTEKLANGDVIFYVHDSGVLSVTNESTGKSVIQNASGPATITFRPNGSATAVSGGHFLLFTSPAEARLAGIPNVVGINNIAGPTYDKINSSGQFVDIDFVGHVTNVCALIT
jgi:hypothetical protein